jgi:hypothetical protein
MLLDPLAPLLDDYGPMVRYKQFLSRSFQTYLPLMPDDTGTERFGMVRDVMGKSLCEGDPQNIRR